MDKLRRQLLQMGFIGAGAVLADPIARLAFERTQFFGLSPANARDAAVNLRAMANGSFTPLLGAYASALASSTGSNSEISVVTIRVMNLIHTPLCLKLGNIKNTSTGEVAAFAGNSAPYNDSKDWNTRLKNAATREFMLAKGIDKVHALPRWQALRLNGWFGEMLLNGRNDAGAVPSGVGASDVAAFPPENEVALQVVLGVNQNDTLLNHSFKNTGFRSMPANLKKGGDFNHHVDATSLVRSPLGLVCLNMGLKIESTDSDKFSTNKVIGSDLVSTIAQGRSVKDYATLLSQSALSGFIDDSLVAKIDALEGFNPTVPQELVRFKSGLASATAQALLAGELETKIHAAGGFARGNVQNFGGDLTNQPAKSEFMAQCKFVQSALDIPRKPFRNFSLFLNISDVDKGPLDEALDTSAGPQCLSYVEGMRQLAIGMNMLAQSIKKHKNVYVVVLSEGGRGGNGGDNKVGHCFVMGPGGAGGLKDCLYGNVAAYTSSTDPHSIEPNEGGAGQDNSPGITTNGAGLRLPDEKVLRRENGDACTNGNELTLSAVLSGLARHIESVQGAAPTTGGLGSYLALKTG